MWCGRLVRATDSSEPDRLATPSAAGSPGLSGNASNIAMPSSSSAVRRTARAYAVLTAQMVRSVSSSSVGVGSASRTGSPCRGSRAVTDPTLGVAAPTCPRRHPDGWGRDLGSTALDAGAADPHRGRMLAAGCVWCSAPVLESADRPGSWSCPQHGVTAALWRPEQVTYEAFTAHLRAAGSFPTYVPWPMGPGWGISDFGCVT